MYTITLKTLALLRDMDSHQNLEPNMTLLYDKDRHQGSCKAITNNQTLSNTQTHPIDRTSLLQLINNPHKS